MTDKNCLQCENDLICIVKHKVIDALKSFTFCKQNRVLNILKIIAEDCKYFSETKE